MLSRLYSLLSPFKWHMFVLCLISLICAADMTLKPYCIKWTIDIVVGLPDTSNLWQAVRYPILGYVSLSVLIFVAYRLSGYVCEIRMTPALRQHVCLWAVDQLMQRQYPFFQQNFAGALSQKVQDLVSSVPDFIDMLFSRFLVVGLAIIIGTLALTQASPVFGALMIVWTFIFLLISWWTTPKLAKLASRWAHVGSAVGGATVDWLTNNFNTLVFGRHEHERSLIKDASDQAIAAEHQQQWANFWIATILGIWTILMHTVAIIFLIQYRQYGHISAGDFALVLTINTALIHQVWQVNNECSRFARIWGRIQQAFDTLYMDHAPPPLPSTFLNITDSSITLKDLVFQYSDSPRPLFKGVSLIIPQGQKVGFVGYSGSGKSTLVHLLLRLFTPQAGEIFIGNHAASQISINQWCEWIGFIPQDPSLFHRSLADNIRYGKLDATDDEVMQAAQQAHAHEFIAQLPHGYDSFVGERGVKLSGGQRQRIAIARAILRNAPILILDEATSQLDSMTESGIQESLWEVMQGKTTLVVAHRLSTLLHMDRIIVLNEGRLAEDGTHQELLAQNGIYKNLWDAQIGDFLGDRKKAN